MKLKRIALSILIVGLVTIAGVLAFQTVLDSSKASVQHEYDVEVAFPNLLFNSPVGVYNAGDGSNRLFVVEQAGVIKVFENTRNVSSFNVFLDISNRVLSGGELGLLGMAFHPNYTANGYFYLDYTVNSPRRSIISRLSVSANDPNQADINSELILLQVEQPFANHNGGQLAFGPDGYLYIALGDGGGTGDPYGNAQNRSTLLGSILRIDINSASGSLNYTIPSDNPFVGNSQGYREEIFAYGLRNPWRFSFDPVSGWLWAADVGQSRIEEIDLIEKGKNYGWNIMEGSLCYSPSSGCNQTGLELPVWEYNHTLGYAVTGGFVYRGSLLTELVGAYIYGDYGSGRIWALWYNGTGAPVNIELVDTSLNIPSFGVDEENELYICAFDGKIYGLRVMDTIPPEISAPMNVPQEPTPEQDVKVTVNVTDDASGVQAVILSYSNDTTWRNLTMSSTGGDAYTTNIPAMHNQTQVRYKITAYDNAGNAAVNDNLGLFYIYTIVPEFPPAALVLMFALATLLAAILHTRKNYERKG
jgi:glucose/arabinose dehydrogenase